MIVLGETEPVKLRGMKKLEPANLVFSSDGAVSNEIETPLSLSELFEMLILPRSSCCLHDYMNNIRKNFD